MLQIGLGKLFKRDIEYQNNLKGIIYTNLRLLRDQKIETVAGSLIPTTNSNESNAVIYEIEELIEACGNEPGTLISHGIDSFILDFSSIISFALNCTASPSYTLVDRLLGDQLGVTTHSIPKQIVSRVFDKSIYCQAEDEEFFIKFTKHLIGLDRKTYLGVMSSIRTYVTGMQRIADDFELAYTLLVASIESLAQNFDGHQSTWLDYDPAKRKVIDLALHGADEKLLDKVRNAILGIEHTSLSRRFQDFSIEHINTSYFREEVESSLNPISKMDLRIALKNAYQARSQYIHKLQKLPKQLFFQNSYTETCRIENKTWLTLQGLSRLARHVITEFILRQVTVDKEPYNYSLERSNIMVLELAPEFWIWQIDFSRGSGAKKLEGFLSQIANCMERMPNSVITELTDLLTELEKRIDSLHTEDKKSFIALYILYNYFIDQAQKIENSKEFSERHQNILFTPSATALIVHHIVNETPKWDLQTHYDCLITYFKERDNKLKFRCPKIFEAGMLLQLAERFRKFGDYAKSIYLIEMAVENYPEHNSLRQFEIDYKLENQEISWNRILLPPKESENTYS